jgi:hypothetical protein
MACFSSIVVNGMFCYQIKYFNSLFILSSWYTEWKCTSVLTLKAKFIVYFWQYIQGRSYLCYSTEAGGLGAAWSPQWGAAAKPPISDFEQFRVPVYYNHYKVLFLYSNHEHSMFKFICMICLMQSIIFLNRKLAKYSWTKLYMLDDHYECTIVYSCDSNWVLVC